MTELDISCLPADLPEFVTVDLANLEVGSSIHLSDVALPNGVTAIAHGENQTVATASVPAGHVATEAEQATAAAAAATAEKK